MPEFTQRLFTVSEPQALNAQAALGPSLPPDRSQFSLLVRHFLERFFNHETASPDGDAKTRMVLIAFTTALPAFIVALYLWPIYHPFIGNSSHPLVLKPATLLATGQSPLFLCCLFLCRNGDRHSL